MSAVLPRSAVRPGTLSAIALVGLAAVVVLVFLDGFRSLVAMWRYSSYGHSYLIPLVSIYFLFRDRERLTALDWRGSFAGLAALAGAVALWLAGRATAIQGIEHVALSAMLVAFLWAVAGTRLLVVAWFPVLYLCLATPVGEEIVPYLQSITADVSVAALNVFGVPAYRDGLFLSLPGGDFEVARACSGFRYLNAGVAMAVLIAYLVLRSAWIRVGFVALVAALFVFVNGIRAFLVMVIASASNMRYMVGDDHIALGYVMFLLLAALSYWLATRLARTPGEAAP